MKKIKIMSLLFIVFSAMTLTSCLDDDDDNNGLSQQEVMTCFNATRGTHTGSLVYQKRGEKGIITTQTDTISGTSWNIATDSTMTINNVPDSALATAIADTTIMKAVKDLNGTQNINCYIGYVRANPVQWLINPITVTYNNLHYNGGTHKVQLIFAINSNYSYGSMTSTKQEMVISVAGLYIDDKAASNSLRNAAGNTIGIKSFLFLEK